MEIKVANEAKQDIGIGKADEILNKINNQQITAQCVKSVQRGAVEYDTYGEKAVSISPVNASKSILIWETDETSVNTTFILKNDGIYPAYNTGRNAFLVWQVIEFY